jgi:hypothetical protein
MRTVTLIVMTLRTCLTGEQKKPYDIRVFWALEYGMCTAVLIAILSVRKLTLEKTLEIVIL